MDTKHIFVSVLDISELLPFAVKKQANLGNDFTEQQRAHQELARFIDALEAHYGEKIYYLGLDVIGEKSYERFMFNDSGFLEVMTENPIAMNAHFPQKARAERFCQALKKTLTKLLPNNPQKTLFINSIEVQDEQDNTLSVESLTVKEWHTITEVRRSKPTRAHHKKKTTKTKKRGRT